MSDPTRVLVVEDDPRSRKLCEHILRHAGYEPVLAESGAAALTAAASQPPDLVLLDIHLPDQSGVDVMKALRARPECEGVNMIALTAMAMADDRERFLSEGFDEHIPTPIDVGSLLRTVERRLASA